MNQINKRALFSDESDQYRIPLEVKPGDTSAVLFRTAKDNADAVFLISGGIRLPMEKYRTNELFDYYRVKLEVKDEKILAYEWFCENAGNARL